MKNGFWNYTDPVTYRVVLVKILAVEKPPLAWQNAFAGTTRQAVEIEGRDTATLFYIDNGDGQGLFKAENRGGPEYGSRHLFPGTFEIVGEVPEPEWIKFTAEAYRQTEAATEAWGKANHPEEWAKVQALKEAWAQAKFNPNRATKR